MKVLFIGGPADGETQDLPLPLRPWFRVLVKPPISSWKSIQLLSTADQTFQTVEYRLSKWKAGEHDFWLYVLQTIANHEAMSRLIANYKGGS